MSNVKLQINDLSPKFKTVLSFRFSAGGPLRLARLAFARAKRGDEASGPASGMRFDIRALKFGFQTFGYFR